ncbi:MAG: CPBP family intramembrane metalloprotease [Thermoplasmata archaeon]|nr:CPBP family intramembrane metalloprotease [Thermoplasmata archaeon]
MAYQEYTEVSEVIPVQEYRQTDADDRKWYGVPAVGTKPIPGKLLWVIIVVSVIIIEIVIWAFYRYITGVVLKLDFGDPLFYSLHIIAAPTIHLGPIFVFWWYIWKEPSFFDYRKRGETFFAAVKKSFPFAITKKLLFSGMIIGFVAAIIWRLLEEFLWDGFAGMVGGTAPETFTFLNVMETMDMILLMTFVMFFVVGPVEEIEFRGFLQDQVARATPNWVAIILPSILFGCSHIPIALFIYKLEGPTFVGALYSWIAAGATFGVLYMYSRQIFACIVMHGMGNWQLSIYYFTSRPIGMDPMTAMWIDIAVATIANGAMIILFYLINEYYWQPHRRGEPAFGGVFYSLQNYIRDHDFGRKKLTQTFAVAIAFMFVVSAVIMGVTVALGTQSLPGESTAASTNFLEQYVEIKNNTPGSGYLNEQQSIIVEKITYDSEEEDILKRIEVTVTWTDEPSSYPLGTNDPDEFKISIIDPNGNIVDESEFSTSGTVTASVELNITQNIDEDYGDWSIQVDAGNCGEDSPRVPLGGIRTTEDNGNAYEYSIDVTWLVPPE